MTAYNRMSTNYKRKRQQRELNDEEKNIIVCVRHCARELDDLLQGARRKAQTDAKQFAETTASSLYRGVQAYADLYEKLRVKSRSALSRLFQRAQDHDDMLDAQDAIEETEGCWRNLLRNIDSDVRELEAPPNVELFPEKSVGAYIDLSNPTLLDLKTNVECSLAQRISDQHSIVLLFQPCYLTEASVRWRYDEVNKVVVSGKFFTFFQVLFVNMGLLIFRLTSDDSM